MLDKMWELILKTNERYIVNSRSDKDFEIILIQDDFGKYASWTYNKITGQILLEEESFQ